MNNAHGLTGKTVAEIQSILAAFPEVKRAILFGSRAKGTFRAGSDIDLALVGEEVDWRVLGRIEMRLDDSMLPYSFSLIELSDRTNADVAAHVQRVGKVFYEKAKPPATPSAPPHRSPV